VKQNHHGTKNAIIYQSLYLANLLLLPGISFLVLLWFFYQLNNQSPFAKIHLYRAVQLSILAGLFIVIIPIAIIFLSPQFEASLMIMLLYFVTLHAGFVLIGMLNLSRAMATKLPLF
jgi:hypothetical protein